MGRSKERIASVRGLSRVCAVIDAISCEYYLEADASRVIPYNPMPFHASLPRACPRAAHAPWCDVPRVCIRAAHAPLCEWRVTVVSPSLKLDRTNSQGSREEALNGTGDRESGGGAAHRRQSRFKEFYCGVCGCVAAASKEKSTNKLHLKT
jgi:hypothetical protein